MEIEPVEYERYGEQSSRSQVVAPLVARHCPNVQFDEWIVVPNQRLARNVETPGPRSSRHGNNLV